MRNLKRVLSLALALVMVLGMMVITTSAADYTDAESIKYEEAVEVMSAIGILNGNPDGTFAPKGTLTREQAAKILAYVCLGAEADDYLTGSSAPFDDVAATKWSAKYIAFCKNAKIINGVGDNKFNPAGTLTTVQFAKMLLVAVGIDGTYTGSGWEANVKQAAKDNGLDVITIDTTDITREEACELALAAMKWSTTPEVYNIMKDGKVVKSFEDMLEAHLYASILGKDYSVKTAEPTDTLLKSVYKVDFDSDTTDAFGRPAVSYKNTAKKINLVYAEEATATYAGADWKDVSKLMEDYDFSKAVTVYNGGTDKTYDKFYGVNGVTVEVYADQDDNVSKVIVSEGYVTEVKDVKTDEKTEITTVTLTVKEAGYFIKNKAYKTVTITSEDKANYPLVKDFAKGDVFMGWYVPGWETSAKLLKVDAVESVEGKVTSKSADTYYNGWVKIDGEKYEFANEYTQATANVKSEGTFYLYNGYIVDFATAKEEDADTVFAYVLATDKEEGGLFATDASYFAQLLYADGTVEVVEILKEDEKATGVVTCVEATGADKGKIDLTAVGGTGSNVTILKNQTYNSYLGGVLNNKTVYVVETIDKNVSTYTVYTGVTNVPSLTAKTLGYAAEDGAWAVIFAMDATLKVDDTTTKNVVYLGQASAAIDDIDLGTYYTYNAIINGEITTVNATTDKLGGLYTALVYNTDGLVKDGTPMAENTVAAAKITAAAKDGVIKTAKSN